jgi:putative intracellular protease/amidase
MKQTFAILILMMLVIVWSAPSNAAARKVLIVLSSEKALTLKDGKTYATGFYMNELGVPLKALIDHGFEPVFSNPKGNQPAMDVHSDKPGLFADENEYKAVKDLLQKSAPLAHPIPLAKISDADLEQFSAIFIPGGHPPMEDLWKEPTLGKIFHHFHEKKKPTALICHGPISLLSTLRNPAAVANSVELKKAPPANTDWLYSGYEMTVFSDAEEKPNEPDKLGGYMKFYPEDALRAAGGKVKVGPVRKSFVVEDRELITGQNPASDKELADHLLKALGE